MKKPERWYPIKDYEGIYEVSNFGAIRSLNRFVKNKSNWNETKGRLLKTNCKNRLYSMVSLRRNDGKNLYQYVHRIVAQTLILNPENKPCINHRDGNKHNNYASNLEWCTYKENHTHRVNHLGISLQGVKNGFSKMNDLQIRIIRKSELPQRYLATLFNVTQGNIWAVRNKTWKHV